MANMKDNVRQPDSGTVALVTGATGAVGKAIATHPASMPAYEVVLLCRNAERAQEAVGDIRRRTGNHRVRYELVDLARDTSITALAKHWNEPNPYTY